MIKKYRIYASILRLEQFTVASLAELSGENPLTVRTVLSRCKDCFSINPTSPAQKKRGGKWKVYVLSPRGKDLINAELSEAFGTLPPNHSGMADPDKAPPLLLSAAAEQIAALERAAREDAGIEFMNDRARRYLNLAEREIRELSGANRAVAEQTLLLLEQRFAIYQVELRRTPATQDEPLVAAVNW